MAFAEFKLAVQRQFNQIKGGTLFRAAVDKDKLWETYLNAFPPGTNPLFRKNTEFDCSCCRHFIKSVGGIVAITDKLEISSLWDINVPEPYQTVANALSALVKSCDIQDVFLSPERLAGTERNYEDDEGNVRTWEHFSLLLPDVYVRSSADIGPVLSDFRATHDVCRRGLTEIDKDALDTVLELIAQNSLYRGEENKHALDVFRKLKLAFLKLKTPRDKDLFVWSKVNTMPGSITRIRNTSIGTLLVALSEGKDLNEAVKAFEAMVAPANYKRPTALVTKAMIEKARKTVEELGLTSALERRYAELRDISINNVLFADREVKKVLSGSVFDDISPTAAAKPKKLAKVEEVSIDDFIANILPQTTSLEVMVENRHEGNLVSLIAPCDLTALGMFKWPNSFSWSYKGEFADSIKERVKRAGGNVTGDLRCSLSWNNFDDLDFHMIEPDGYHIYFANRSHLSPSKGMLDVDMNAGHGQTRSAVENICYPNRVQMKEGEYQLSVHNFMQRETVDVGFEVEIEVDGNIQTFSYPKAVKQSEYISVAKITYSKKNGLKVDGRLPSTQTVREIWGLNTQTYHKVQAVMLSPNYWSGHGVGNKHYFFMLEGCKNAEGARGFYNEFLSAELNEHRKVLEMVGAKMKTEESENQLSGIGFSSTQRNSVLCRVKGGFTREIKVTF